MTYEQAKKACRLAAVELLAGAFREHERELIDRSFVAKAVEAARAERVTLDDIAEYLSGSPSPAVATFPERVQPRAVKYDGLTFFGSGR